MLQWKWKQIAVGEEADNKWASIHLQSNPYIDSTSVLWMAISQFSSERKPNRTEMENLFSVIISNLKP